MKINPMVSYRAKAFIAAPLFLFILAVPRADDQHRLLIISPKGGIFDSACVGIGSELAEAFIIKRMDVSTSTTADEFGRKISQYRPEALALLDNTALRLYKEYLSTATDSGSPLPAVALLAIEMEYAISGIRNIRGIAYETPMVTALVKLGNVLKTPIVRVGTIFRKKFEPFVAQQTIYCRHEKIEVVSIILDDKKDLYPTKIREGIKDLVRNKKVNALWLPNDNAILNAALITGTWIPLMSKINVPLVVGVESLVKPELHFGTFAVVPDSRAAGEQAANLLYDCMNNSWHFDKTTVYPPISVYSVLNLEKAKNITKISKIKLEYVDKVLTTTDRK